MEKKYPIKVLADKTGLSLHVIRAWEKRYSVVEPLRTTSNRRLYSDDDVHHYRLLKSAVDKGYNIGNIAKLSVADLEELTAINPTKKSEGNTYNTLNDPDTHLEKCLNAIYTLDATVLESELTRASVSLSHPVLIESVVIPLVEKIGQQWREGRMRIMHEHMASAVLKTYLTNLRNSYRPADNAPVVVLATPSGQLHEIGALILAFVAASEGWKVIYLGADLPAEEIAAAAIHMQAKSVVLSIVYPANDPLLFKDLEKLRTILPVDKQIIIGGRVASFYQSVIDKISALSGKSIADFRKHLENIEML